MRFCEFVDAVVPVTVVILKWLLLLVVLLLVVAYAEVYAVGTTYTAGVRDMVNSYVYPVFPEGYENVFKPEGYDNVFKPENMSTRNMYREESLARSAY